MRTAHGFPPLNARALAAALFAAGMLVAGGCTETDRISGPEEPTVRPVGPRTQAVVPTSGLIGEWKMDEAGGTTANDSKNNYDATLNGQAGFVDGHLSNALALNNDQTGLGDDFATMPSNTDLDNVQEGSYTLSAWFFPETVPLDQTQTNRYYSIVTKEGAPMGLVYNNVKKFSMRHYLTGDVLQFSQGISTFAEGHWYHVAGVVNKTAGTIKVYVDGVPQDTVSFTPGTAATEYGTTRFQVGKTGARWAADGKVDQVRIYNRALSDAEVVGLSDESQPPTTRPLPVGVFGDAVGNGPGGDATGQPWSVVWLSPQPSSISSDIDEADAKNILLVLLMPANKGAYTNASEEFSLQLYKNQLDRWIAGNAHSKVDVATENKIKDAMARRRIVCYIIDEPNLKNFASPAQVDSMAREHKTRWPSCLTFARTTPTLLKNGWGPFPRTTTYPKLDYAWSQYSYAQVLSNLTPAQVWAQERQAITAAGFNMGLAVSLNLWAGGINQNMGGQQACWDYARNGTSSGYVLGDREEGNEADLVTCGNLGSPVPSVIASPNWIKYFAQQVASDGGFPFLLMWEAADAPSSSERFVLYYGRSDFVSAFSNAIQTGQGAQAAAWRTPK